MSGEVREASEMFDAGRYCSQAVLGAFCEKYGMSKESAFRISCGLNSGSRCAELCGAVSGAVLVIGLRYGDSKSICNSKTEEFMRAFREKNGSVVCRDILGCDIFTPEGKAKAIDGNMFEIVCKKAVEDATQILCDLGY